jgi:hypothetical protein
MHEIRKLRRVWLSAIWNWLALVIARRLIYASCMCGRSRQRRTWIHLNLCRFAQKRAKIGRALSSGAST